MHTPDYASSYQYHPPGHGAEEENSNLKNLLLNKYHRILLL